ncbi:ATPase, V1/A1 complex, subunit E [Thelephora terrestris]|uniref:ATPase, V1/A1 complex, subunit E n=1 Tax=Thelephora terrestris TaxID=56493 RepID=A0A9P6L9N0_9AGAM|nr:ATPase, V1/A1 complex, subunit E [Thelephora terrestris]
MASRPMNDEEVLTEMNKMVAFIKQEALEKAREVRVKADEEFSIEKAKLVKQAQQAINAQYEKKRKGAEVSQKIAHSTLTNKSRLRILHLREQHLQDLFQAAREQLATLASSSQYVQFLQGIIAQGFLQLLEAEVSIHVREADAAAAKDAAAAASNQYTEISGRRVKYELVSSLSPDLAGGIKLVSGNKRITLDNSLDERLRLLEDRMLPEIRYELYGKNENRRFQT